MFIQLVYFVCRKYIRLGNLSTLGPLTLVVFDNGRAAIGIVVCGVNQNPFLIHCKCPKVTLSNSFSADPNTMLHPRGKSDTWSSIAFWIRHAPPRRDHLNS